jgi:hypothetical protein
MKALRALVRLLDEAVAIPGTRFRVGLDGLLGLIPGVGDVTGAVMTGFTVLTAFRLGAPPAVLLNMVVNLGIDAAAGAVPLLGDLFDIGFKANRRNLDLLERYLARPQATRRSSGVALAGILALLLFLLAGLIWLAWTILSALAAALGVA